MKRKRTVYPDLNTALEALGAQGVTQKDFAARLGMSEGYLSDLKNGRVRPSLQLAARLSEEAGVPIQSFLNGESAGVNS